MVKLDNLYFKYNETRGYVLKNISTTFEPGVVNVLLGVNGSGKTTLFDIISGILLKKVDKGVVHGVNIKDTMYMTQGMLFPMGLKGKDLIRLFLKGDYRYQSKKHHDFFDDEYFKEKLEYLSNTYYGDMSIGERRWLTFTLAMKLERKIYLFDEPTSGVDPHSKVDILDSIMNLSKNKNKVVIMSTHVLHDLSEMNCKIHLLHRGKINFVGTYDEFLKKFNHSNPDKAFRNFIDNYLGEVEQDVL
ncbi:ABC-2 type transport system ATP-binding protein [Cerasibacillus quisquiliarum]|uniref:ABC transporter n=1 Tax=Cerasibacillus quisquiliarum TaxID=227865 RepID=A0A511UYM9_9BACI|nr:ABC transporter ATP-binding protein [Cerasibacillus quisquiliarum]MBB5146246.1 ABC-2 type transport system ATP-binding protein [Cerasibacillus quisquiliarum]GEN30573.1 ABC transporter [Cerasibacillus quisquiliarum]